MIYKINDMLHLSEYSNYFKDIKKLRAIGLKTDIVKQDNHQKSTINNQPIFGNKLNI